MANGIEKLLPGAQAPIDGTILLTHVEVAAGNERRFAFGVFTPVVGSPGNVFVPRSVIGATGAVTGGVYSARCVLNDRGEQQEARPYFCTRLEARVSAGDDPRVREAVLRALSPEGPTYPYALTEEVADVMPEGLSSGGAPMLAAVRAALYALWREGRVHQIAHRKVPNDEPTLVLWASAEFDPREMLD